MERGGRTYSQGERVIRAEERSFREDIPNMRRDMSLWYPIDMNAKVAVQNSA